MPKYLFIDEKIQLDSSEYKLMGTPAWPSIFRDVTFDLSIAE